MSYTTILKITKSKTKDIKELRNSHLSCPIVWNFFGTTYLGLENFMFHEKMDQIWELWKDTSIPLSYRAVLFMTFDRACVHKKDFKKAASDIEIFLKASPANLQSHWPEIAKMFESDPKAKRIGFWMTSVSENPFEELDLKTESYKLRHTPFWNIYKELKNNDHGM